MSNDKTLSADVATSGMVMANQFNESVSGDGVYYVECVGADGQVKWTDMVENLWTTVGKNDVLDKYMAGSAYTQTLAMGLKGTGSAALGDTQTSHAAWLEVGLANAPTYTAPRKTPNFSTGASAGSKSTVSAVSFLITSTGTVAGLFLNNGGTTGIDNTTGVLFSAGDFTGGSRAVINGDTLNVTYTASLT